MPWHVTRIENVESILRDGLVPQIGELSQRIGEPVPLVYLFSTMEDLEDGCNWLDDELDEDDEHALLHVDVPKDPESGWTEVSSVITPDRLIVITREFSAFIPDQTHHALDAQRPAPEDEDRCGI